MTTRELVEKCKRLMLEYGSRCSARMGDAAIRSVAGELRAAIDELAASLPSGVPEGWTLVPAEITEEMHAAAVRTIVRCSGNDDFPPRVYRAMLAASPEAPAPQGVQAAPTHEQMMAGYEVACQFGVYERKAFDLAEVMFKAMNATPSPPAVQPEPLYLLHCGKIDSGGEQDEFDAEPDSYKRVEAFCRQHPGQTIGLYPRPAVSPDVQELDPIRALIAKHAELLESNPYCYFELAYTRKTEWMAWLCSKPREDDPERKVLTKGQGFTADEACEDALSKYGSKQ